MIENINKILDDYLNDYYKKVVKNEIENKIERLQARIDKAIEYIKTSMNNPQPFYEYLFGDEDGKVENLDKLLNILQGSDKE